MNKKETSWGGVAKWYDDMLENSSDSYQKNVLMPNLIRIIDPKPGMTLFDIACGQGYFARACADNGAQVIGCDISPELIALAKTHQGKNPVDFKVAPADKIDFAQNNSADLVLIVLALQNIENLSGAVAEASRILKPGGRFIAVINHPAFRIPQRSTWGWDDSTSKQFRRLDAYMSDERIKIDMTPGEKDVSKKRFTTSFHRPLQSYVKALTKAGLAITRLEEWISHKKSQEGPRAIEEDRMRKEIPMFICLEAKKV